MSLLQFFIVCCEERTLYIGQLTQIFYKGDKIDERGYVPYINALCFCVFVRLSRVFVRLSPVFENLCVLSFIPMFTI